MKPSPIENIPVTVTYLEQTSRPFINAPAPNGKVALLRAENPPLHFYRYLYRLIGAPYNWVSRALYSDEELRVIIENPKVHIYVLYINGVPGGFCEIDGRHALTPEIRFFGLAPEFIGKGYGRYFLAHTIDIAWTCTGSPDLRASNLSDNKPAQKTGTDPERFSTMSPGNGPKCVRLETCSLDHPAALPLYQKFGFSVVDRRDGVVPKLVTHTDPITKAWIK